jgi:hypothetical protein
MMVKTPGIRWKWLNAMYIYTAAGAGICGLALLIAPVWLVATFNLPAQDHTVLGMMGSISLAFGLLSLLRLRWPLRFVRRLLLQLTSKATWILTVLIPLFFASQPPAHALIVTATLASYIISDCIAIPFRYLFSNGPSVEANPVH